METPIEYGTTLLTFILKGDPAILMMSDRQATPPTEEPFIYQKIYELVRDRENTKMNIGLAMCGDGTHGDKLLEQLKDYMKTTEYLRVEDYARVLIGIERRRPVNRRSHFFLSGFDEDEEGVLQPHVFLVNKGSLVDLATTELEIAQNRFWLGSGGRYTYPYFDKSFSTHMTIAQAVELGANTVFNASIHCPYTGKGLQVMLIRPNKEIVTWTLTDKSLRKHFRRTAIH